MKRERKRAGLEYWRRTRSKEEVGSGSSPPDSLVPTDHSHPENFQQQLSINPVSGAVLSTSCACTQLNL